MWRFALLPAVVALALASGAPARAQTVDRTVRAGMLSATIDPDPFRIRVGPLEGLPGETLSANGIAAGKVVAERRDGDAYVAGLDNGIQLRVSPDADGVIRISAGLAGATSIATAFGAAPGERFLGLGERSNAVDFRGRQVENRVTEGPYQKSERPIIAGFVPPPGYNARDDATYYPVPWFVSTRGYGVLLDSDATSAFDFASSRAGVWSARVPTSSLTFRVFAGPTPAAALARFTERTGRQPPPAAPWFFGPWWQPKGDDRDNLETLRKARAVGSVVQTYTHYLPCGDHAGKRDAERARTALFHKAGLAVTTYFNPMICTSHPRYQEAADAGVLTKNAAGQPYAYRYTGASQFLVGQFDFSNPAATPFYGSLLQEAVDDGYDGWMEDFGEYTPEDSLSADGRPGSEEHNLYVTLYHRAARAFSARTAKPLARFNRSGWIGTAAASQIVWGGDPTTGWGFDGLASALRNGLSMGMSGVSLWGSDIGGYFALSVPQTTPELLRRWIELGFVSGVMRTEADGFTLLKSARAQIFDKDVLPVWARYARLRTQLLPYLAAAQREYERSGLPIMRHLALAYPTDARATARDDEELFGPDLLAAPVLEPGAVKRRLYLPEGRWVELWRSARLTRDTALRPTVARVRKGPGDVTVEAPQNEIPLLVRAGALIPMLDPAVETLTGYGDGVVRLGDRAGRMTIVGWPSGTSKTEIGAGETVTVKESRGRLIARVRARRRYRLNLWLSTDLLRRPCKHTHVRHLVIRGRRAQLAVLACPRG
ncbi:MAG TPA: TIM-barrel domain-containing protein [Thermoleophilaceae bacterium]|nr:TIM-barrel domain-containing protein [Thermoleophilaceae bacterium]